MKNKLMLSLCVAGAVTLSGCTTVADMAGADTASLNVAATQGFNKTNLFSIYALETLC